MDGRIIGTVKRVNGPVIEVSGITDAMMMELVYIGEGRLIGELVKLSGNQAVIQVYEDTTGIAPGDNVYGSGMPLSVELGPGLIGTIYDGIQRPLEELQKICGEFIKKGVTLPGLSREKSWHFVPSASAGDEVSGGMVLGTVQETPRILHKILVPPDMEGKIVSVAGEGDYKVTDTAAVLSTAGGEKEISLLHYWSIRKPRPVKERRAFEHSPDYRAAGHRHPLSSGQGGNRRYSRRLRDRQDHDPARNSKVVRC